MNSSEILIALIFFAVGIGFIALYGVAARRLYGVQLDFVQMILYKVDTKGFSVGKRLLEVVLRGLKFFGLLFAIISPFIAFH